MLIVFCLGLSGAVLCYGSSLHILSLLLLVELFLMVSVLLSFILMFSNFFCLMLMLIGVCVGVFGLCLFIFLRQSKSLSYLGSFAL